MKLLIKFKFFIFFILVITSIFFSKIANSDEVKDLALRVDADSLKHDDKNLVTTFTGNVVMVRNNLTIKGELLQLKQTESGLSYGHILGNPAKFKQKLQARRRAKGEGRQHVEGPPARRGRDARPAHERQ